MGEPKLLTQRDRKALCRAGWDLLDGAGLQLVLERYEATVADLEGRLEEARGTIEILKEAIEGYLDYLNDTGEIIARQRQEIDELDMKGAVTTRMLRERLERLCAAEEGR